MNKYHIYEQQARGKYSVIFKARKKKKLQFVAIKRIDKCRKKKIMNEAKILNDLKHSNIIKFHDFMQTKNHMWAVTQYCPGGDLLKLIEQDKSLPENIVRSFTIEIMRGLQYLHSKGIVHCDLKPAGILINQYGNMKLGDFGSAQYLIDLMHNENENKKGTPCYMAPQLFQVEGVYSFQSDLWALGCIIYELAQGNPPFVSASLQDIAKLAQNAETPKIQHFSSDFNYLLESILMKQPQKRIKWEEIGSHPWVCGELKTLQIPSQHHFNKYLKNKAQNSPYQHNLLRASQQIENDYGEKNKMNADNRRSEFIFETDLQNNTNNPHQTEQQHIIVGDNELYNSDHNKQQLKTKINSKRPIVSQIQDSSNINIFMETLSSKNMPPLEDTINHSSDNSVKPIIGNKDIQVLQSMNFNKHCLGFTYIEPQVLAEGVLNGQMNQQLKRILDGMTGEEKYNVLGYFQSIIQNSEIANYLFKTNFISFYLKLMKGYKQSSLRAKICEILGFLIRHATAIDPDILKYGIVNGFLEATKDKSEKVRRKAMAALGQLLFYGATQVDENISEWDISINLIHNLLKILKNTNEDQIVRIYCCKSIENITAQAKDVGLKFAQIDTLLVLINSFNTTKNQSFKNSICCCFHHIISLNMTLKEFFLQKIGIKNIKDSFRSTQTHPKTIQILLWIFLIQFEKSPKSKLSKSLLQDENLFNCILNLLDINSIVVKGRIYLYCYYIMNYNLKWVIYLLDSKIFQIIERHGKDTTKYQTQCLQFVLVVLYENYPQLIDFTEQSIRIRINHPYSNDINAKTGFIGVISHMISCPCFQQLLHSYINISDLMGVIQLLDLQEINPALQVIKSHYMQVVQKIISNNIIAQKLQQDYANNLLPFLIGKVLRANQNDIRFCCMKFMLYLVGFYMSEQYLYDDTVLTSTSSKISTLITEHLIPQLDFLLSQDQTVALMTLKLIAVLFQIDSSFIVKFYGNCQLNYILKFFNNNSSVNVLRVIQSLTSSNLLNQNDLKRLLPTTEQLLIFYSSSGQEIFLEYPLQILLSFIKWDLFSQQSIDRIWQIVVPLQNHVDMVIHEKSQNLIQQFLKYFKISSNGKWQFCEKKGASNYDKFMKISKQLKSKQKKV